jgi:hypothetical protein
MRMMPEKPVFGDLRRPQARPEADSQAIENRTKINGLWR